MAVPWKIMKSCFDFVKRLCQRAADGRGTAEDDEPQQLLSE